MSERPGVALNLNKAMHTTADTTADALLLVVR